MAVYSLSFRQKRCFTDVVDIYQMQGKVSLAADLATETIPAAAVSPSFSGVRCRIETKKEASVPLPIGRSNYDITDTTDLIHLHMKQEIGDGDYVRLRTPGHPENGTWFTIQGEAQIKAWRSGSQELLLKKATAPPFIPAGD